MCKRCLKEGLTHIAPIHGAVRLQQRRVTWEWTGTYSLALIFWTSLYLLSSGSLGSTNSQFI